MIAKVKTSEKSKKNILGHPLITTGDRSAKGCVYLLLMKCSWLIYRPPALTFKQQFSSLKMCQPRKCAGQAILK